MRKKLRAALGTVVLTTATLAPVALGASAAHAAELQCNTVSYTWQLRNGEQLFMPSLYPSFTPYDCVVIRGMRDSGPGGPVRQLQVSLWMCYDKHYVVGDGDFGPLTERAVREVQAQVGVKADGRYGPKTRAAMKHQASREGWCFHTYD